MCHDFNLYKGNSSCNSKHCALHNWQYSKILLLTCFFQAPRYANAYDRIRLSLSTNHEVHVDFDGAIMMDFDALHIRSTRHRILVLEIGVLLLPPWFELFKYARDTRGICIFAASTSHHARSCHISFDESTFVWYFLIDNTLNIFLPTHQEFPRTEFAKALQLHEVCLRLPPHGAPSSPRA